MPTFIKAIGDPTQCKNFTMVVVKQNILTALKKRIHHGRSLQEPEATEHLEHINVGNHHGIISHRQGKRRTQEDTAGIYFIEPDTKSSFSTSDKTALVTIFAEAITELNKQVK